MAVGRVTGPRIGVLLKRANPSYTVAMTRRRLAVTLLALPAAASLAAVLMAQEATQRARVLMTNGRAIEGELVDRDADEVTLRIAGITTRIPTDQVERVEMVLSMREQLLEQRAVIEDDDLAARFDLARQMAAAGELELARDELEAIRRAAPRDERVRAMLTQVEQRIRLRQDAPSTGDPATPAPTPRNGTTRPAPPPEGGDGGGEQDPGAQRMNRLTTDDINKIRVWEIDLGSQPRVRVPQETLDQLFERYADDPDVPKGMAEQAVLRRAPGHEQLEAIFQARAQDLYDQVQVLEDPPAMQAWRTNVHATYVLSYCASPSCHGGETDAMKALPLLRDRDLTGAYTNFYILQNFQNAQGDMIERDPARLAQSLLLQYGLPQDTAQFRHPVVKGWRPFFARTDDRRYQQYLDSLAMLWNPAPKYGVTYDPWAAPEDTAPGVTPGVTPGAAPEAAGDGSEREATPTTLPRRPDIEPLIVPELNVPLEPLQPMELDDPPTRPAPVVEQPTGDDAIEPVDEPMPIMP